jgi:hypothetical protein
MSTLLRKGNNRALFIDGAEVTATAAEINVGDGVTAGTVIASKAVVAGAGKDLDDIKILSLRNTTGIQAQAFQYALAAAAGVGGVLNVENPLAVPCTVVYLGIDITTASTGAATVDAGVDTDGSSSADDMIDGLDANNATGWFTSDNDAGTNGESHRRIGTTEHIVISKKTGDVAGLAGNAVFVLQPLAPT